MLPFSWTLVSIDGPSLSYVLIFKGEIQALFLRHEGYLGAIGAFLKGAEEKTDSHKYSWGEHLPGSSGLQSPVTITFLRQDSSKVRHLH